MPTTLRVTITTKDGQADAYVARPSGSGPFPAVLFYMDGVGLRDALYAMADRLASHGYYVLMPNMFYRHGPYAPFDPKTVFNGGPERDRLMGVFKSIDRGRAMEDTVAFLAFLDAQKEARAQRIGCLGYCMGGNFAFTAATAFPERVAAAASIHGARLANDEPDSPYRNASKIRGEIYIGVSEIDSTHTPETTKRLETALGEAGVRHTIELYPGVAHGFAVPDVPPYDVAAAERHWERILALFARSLSS